MGSGLLFYTIDMIKVLIDFQKQSEGLKQYKKGQEASFSKVDEKYLIANSYAEKVKENKKLKVNLEIK